MKPFGLYLPCALHDALFRIASFLFPVFREHSVCVHVSGCGVGEGVPCPFSVLLCEHLEARLLITNSSWE